MMDVTHTLVVLILCVFVTTSWQKPLILRSTYKGLRGIAPSTNIFSSGLNRAVYYYDQAVAVVDIKLKNEMVNCDIVEGYEPQEIQEILRNLSRTVRPMEVTFSEMTELMYRCEQLDRMQSHKTRKNGSAKGTFEKANEIGANALNLLAGILPGTKWCGTGDIASDYHDLGAEVDIDRCCRSHDLCPVKIRAQRTRYNLTNYSLYSKSHCMCDNALYHCLKEVDNPTAKIIGKLYFNVVKVECVDDSPSDKSGKSKKIFSSTGLSF